MHISIRNPARRLSDNSVLDGTATSNGERFNYKQPALLNLSTVYKQNYIVIINANNYKENIKYIYTYHVRANS